MIDEIKGGSQWAREEFARVLIPFLTKLHTRITISSSELLSSINWTITKILNNIDMLDKHKSVLSYISNAVKNFCIDEYRKVSVRKRREDEFKSITTTTSSGVTHTLEFMLDDLTKDKTERQILSKIILDKKSVEDISTEMSVPRREIDDLLQRVKTQLT